MAISWDRVKARLEGEPDDLRTTLIDQFTGNKLDSIAILNGFLGEPQEERTRLIDRLIVHDVDDLWFSMLRRYTPCELLRLRELVESTRAYSELVVPHQLANASPLNRILNEVYRTVLSKGLDNTLFPSTSFLSAHFFSRSWYSNDDEYDPSTLSASAYFLANTLVTTQPAVEGAGAAYVVYRDMPQSRNTPLTDPTLLDWINRTRLEIPQSLYTLYKTRPDSPEGSGYHRMHQELLVPGRYGLNVRYPVGAVRTRSALQITVHTAYRLLRTPRASVQTGELVALFREYAAELRTMPPDTPLETILSLLDRVCVLVQLDEADGGAPALQTLCLQAKQSVRDAIQRRFDDYSPTDDFRVLFGDAGTREQIRASYDWLLPPVADLEPGDDVRIRRQECILWLNLFIAELMIDASLTEEQEDMEVVAAVAEKEKEKAKKAKKTHKQKGKSEKKRHKHEKEKEKKRHAVKKEEKKRGDKSKKKAGTTEDEDKQTEASQRSIKKRKLARVTVTELGDGTRLLSVIKGSGLLQITGGGFTPEYSTMHCVTRGYTMRLPVDANYAVYVH